MKKLMMAGTLVMVWVICDGSSFLRAQQAPELVLYNGKIVTMDNHTVSENLGTMAQAIAIQDGKVLAVGTNDQIRRLAGSSTKSLDLKGRVVTPGFGATHDHPADWNVINPTVVKKVVSDDMHIERFLNVPANEVLQQLPRVLNEAVGKAKPGQWVRISLLFGTNYEWGDEVGDLFGRQINKQMLDLAAPNNPVEVKGGFTGMVVNQRAIDEVKKWYGDQWSKFLYPPLGDLGGAPTDFEKTGQCGTCYRYVEQDVIFEPEALREIYRLGLSWTTAIGVTLNGTAVYTSGAMRAYDSLDRAGQMAMRLAYGYFWPFRNDVLSDPYFAQFVASQVGRGSDHLWNAGATTMMGGGCSKLPGTSPEVKQREAKCRFDPQAVNGSYQALYTYFKAGGRLFGDHQSGDGEIDLVMELMAKAAKDSGMTPEQIQAKRHVAEHMSLWPRPDQIPQLKSLGMMTSGFDINFWEGAADRVLRDYGERGVLQKQPRKSLYDAGIMNSMEIDRPIADYTNVSYFQVLHSAITKKNREGKVLAPQQAISREAALKSATLFASYGTLKEKVLGSLEPGKWADLAVLDKDYFTIPVDDLPKIRILMTMVGGKPAHLAPSLAREWGMQPAGAQVELGGPAAQW